jgi:hypothetical protein
MSNSMRATELSGTIDEQGNLHLDIPVSQVGPGRVRVILLSIEDAEADEEAWLRSAAKNPAFDFLHDPAEDIYSPDDGKDFDG